MQVPAALYRVHAWRCAPTPLSAPNAGATLRRKISGALRGRYKVSLEIADKDVEAELQLHAPADNTQVGCEYTLRPIVLIVPRGSPDLMKHANAMLTRCAAVSRIAPKWAI
jgi:hypothetical protein